MTRMDEKMSISEYCLLSEASSTNIKDNQYKSLKPLSNQKYKTK